MSNQEQNHRRHHLLIAGTGRAGTSALVRYMTDLGLDAHISRHGEASAWFDDTAQAGFEDLPVAMKASDLPYVVKSPWSYQLIEAVLADPDIQLDAVVVPMRDLIKAAASRTIVELQTVHQKRRLDGTDAEYQGKLGVDARWSSIFVQPYRPGASACGRLSSFGGALGRG